TGPDDAHPAPAPAQRIPPNTPALPPAAHRKNKPPPIESSHPPESAPPACSANTHPPPPTPGQASPLQSPPTAPSLSPLSHEPTPDNAWEIIARRPGTFLPEKRRWNHHLKGVIYETPRDITFADRQLAI